MAGKLDLLEANLVYILLEWCIRLNIAFASLPLWEWILAKEGGSHGLLKKYQFGSFLYLQPMLVFHPNTQREYLTLINEKHVN